jgi:septal ring factor EnvC (AmiA/AmiB activator)
MARARLAPALYKSAFFTKMRRAGVGLQERELMEPQRRKTLWEDDAVVPELVDRLEYREEQLTLLQEQLATLHKEREQLETDLVIAERWVAALAKELELADAQLKQLRPLQSRIGHFRPVE